MNYELAKQLKDAGFPQQNIQIFLSRGEANYFMSEHSQIAKMVDGNLEEMPYIPTLRELIDACIEKNKSGDRFFLEYVSEELWVAGFQARYSDSQRDIGLSAEGSTPEEAVANLWLQLNKKND